MTGGGRQWRLAVTPAVEGFEIEGIFDLIQRTRLASLDSDSDLALSLACDCDVNAYRFQDRYLVIDISDPDPASASRDGLPDPGPEDAAAAADRRAAAAAALPDLTRLLTAGAPSAPDTDTPDPGRTPASPAAPSPADIALEDAAAIMAEQLARAAASGLLEAELGRPLSDGDPLARGGASDPDQEMPPAAQVDALAEDADHASRADVPVVATGQVVLHDIDGFTLPIRAETAFDAARHGDAGAEAQRAPLACMGRDIDISAWADGAGVDHGIGALRLALFDDGDRLVRDAALNLARHYLYYGFGAEAAFWLNQLDEPPQTLVILARLMDGLDGPGFPPVTDPFDCSQTELFWRYLAGSLAVPLSDEDLGEIQRSHAALPAVLRDNLGPELARRLHADGFSGTARNIVETLARGGRLPRETLALLDLDIGLAGPSEGMRDLLSDALASGPSDPAQTMAQALALDRRAGRPPLADRIVAAEALLRETPAGDNADALWRDVILAHAANGDVDRAITMLSNSETHDPDIRQEVITRLLEGRLDRDDTAGLAALAHLFGAGWTASGSEAGRIRVAAITHLREAGLWRAASMLRDNQRTLILPARPAPPPNRDDILNAARAAGDWALVAETADGPWQALATRMLAGAADTSGPPDAPAPATQSTPELVVLSQIVDDSRALRESLGLLLEQPDAP